ncbi:MAG: uroporphyrinogen-III synthase, partial [Eubacterium sp.]|nr:uroporphyrinogen-III synthase [Eubacterium sp.]
FNYDIFDCGTLEVKKYDFDLDLSCEYIVFTSATGVNIFKEYLREKHIDIRKLAGIKFAVIGKSTYEALAELGIYADVMPEKYTAEELSKALSGFKGKKLILRAEKGSDDLLKYIRNYEDVKIYDVEISNVREANTDYIIFGSPSAVNFYCGKYTPKGKIIAIGEVTAKRLGEYGYSPYIAEEYNTEGIIKKLEEIENAENEKAQNKPQYQSIGE